MTEHATNATARKPARRVSQQLERARIVATALQLVDREGLKALSMRRLGAELGVDPMAVYYYLPNKQALLDAIVEAVMAQIDLDCDDPAAPAEERILLAAVVYRQAMMAHPNALPIVLAHGPATAVALRPVEVLVGILRQAGLAPAAAMAGMNAIAALVRGSVGMMAAPAGKNDHFQALLDQLRPNEFPNLFEAIASSAPCPQEAFAASIRALARGLLNTSPV